MPSALTHALVGAALTPLAPRQAGRARTALALAAVALAPDLDVIAFRFDIPYDHALGHRGATHSLAFAAGMALAAGWVVFHGHGLTSRRWWRLVGLLFLAGASHGLLDAFTDAGLGVAFFLPFHGQRYFFPWRPILTSPFDPLGFFGRKGLRILATEIRWVWAPLGGMYALGIAGAWLRRRVRLSGRRVRGRIGEGRRVPRKR